MKIINCIYANESGHVVKNIPVEIPDEVVNDVMAYEAGNLSQDQTIIFFQKLIDTGLVLQLQGSYGRLAKQLIDAGLCFVRTKEAA